MDLSLDETQQLIQESARDFVKALLPYYESEIYDILFGETEASDTGR